MSKKTPLTIANTTLKMISYEDGVQSYRDATLENCSVDVSVTQNADKLVNVEGETKDSFKGIKAGSNLYIIGGIYNINSTDDAVHANGNVTITDEPKMDLATSDDGVHADVDLLIESGSINVTQSYEGLEGSTVTINDGTITLAASDDGINSAGGSDSEITKVNNSILYYDYSCLFIKMRL